MNTSIVRRGDSKKGNPVLFVGGMIVNRACAGDLLKALRDESEALVAGLVELVGLQEQAKAKPAVAVPAPTPPVVVTEPRPAPITGKSEGTGADTIRAAETARKEKTERQQVAAAKAKAETPSPTVDDTITPALREQAKTVKVKGAHLYKSAAKLRAAIQEKGEPTPAPAPTVSVRTMVADFVNTLPDGRELYTAVYSDGTIVNEITTTAKAAA